MKKARLQGFKVIASGCALGVTVMVLSSMFGAQAFAGKADDTLPVFNFASMPLRSLLVIDGG